MLKGSLLTLICRKRNTKKITSGKTSCDQSVLNKLSTQEERLDYLTNIQV